MGLCFYIYYIFMVCLMDVCVEYDCKILILDWLNLNGYYVDGLILDMKYKLGVGGLFIFIVYGMILGEFVLMVNGEWWLFFLWICDVIVIFCKNYIY